MCLLVTFRCASLRKKSWKWQCSCCIISGGAWFQFILIIMIFTLIIWLRQLIYHEVTYFTFVVSKWFWRGTLKPCNYSNPHHSIYIWRDSWVYFIQGVKIHFHHLLFDSGSAVLTLMESSSRILMKVFWSFPSPCALGEI